jgi:tRNA threonylcarbamoyladenosine biosynthesis protein TsaE
LGAGKTVLAKGLCEGFGYTGNVTSPSYSLLNIYEAQFPIYHFDLYRLENAADLEDIGFSDYLYNGRGTSIVEWSDRVPGALPPESLEFNLRILGENKRQISIRFPESCYGGLGQSI